MENKTDHMQYMPGMEIIDSDMLSRVTSEMDAYDYTAFTAHDVENALSKDVLSPRDFQAMLSPAAEPYLEAMANRAQTET